MNRKITEINSFILISLFLVIAISLSSCDNKRSTGIQGQVYHITDSLKADSTEEVEASILVGASQLDKYADKLQNKKVGMVVNQTSVVGSTHIVDSLMALGIDISVIFAPEHGFRGEKEAGKHISNSVDSATGIKVVSIYGKSKKPSPKELENLDIMIFDMQDVGARFFTYIVSMHYIMESCAENGVPLIVLDRPNPLGHYTDGPVLKEKFKSFIGKHTVPVIHGMTIGEFAQMINGEGWLNDSLTCDLTVIKVANYDHHTFYELPVNPSPNLPDMKSIYLYPSICFFEGTIVSEGRGTIRPFQQFGTPDYTPKDNFFIPVSMPGFCAEPKFKNDTVFGYNLSETPIAELQAITKLDIQYLIEFYEKSNKKKFFGELFNLLAGNDELKKQIIAGVPENEIRESWNEDLEKFREIRKKYLLYDE